ncbi:hypothetical protein ACVIGB_001466 [Bradyrhizobium sp. USDA 4341]
MAYRSEIGARIGKVAHGVARSIRRSGELHGARPWRDVAAVSFGTASLSVGYNVAGKATDPVKAKDVFD